MRTFLSMTFLLSILTLQAQDLDAFNIDRLQLNKQGMVVLGTWALVNMVSSPIFASQTTGSKKAFHQMNGYWNSVNLVIAGVGYYTAFSTDPMGLTLTETIREQHSMEKILLFNAGLDLAYMAGGWYLWERSKNVSKNADRLKGFGQSVILQGGFLFLFDLGFCIIQQRHGRILYELVDTMALSPGGFQLGWYF